MSSKAVSADSVRRWTDSLARDPVHSTALMVSQDALAFANMANVSTTLSRRIPRVFAYTSVRKAEPSKNSEQYQQSSGRCWIFATLNVIRELMMREYQLADSFNLSHSFVQFYHRIEQCNAVLEHVYDMRQRGVTVDGAEFALYVSMGMVADGGSWPTACAILEKYGICPMDVYPSNNQANNTRDMSSVLEDIVLTAAYKVMTSANGRKAFAAVKQEALQAVHRVLCVMLGTPPARFDWAYYVSGPSASASKRMKKKQPNAVDAEAKEIARLTPEEFYRRVVRRVYDPTDFVMLKCDERHPFGRWHELQYGQVVLADSDTAQNTRAFNASMDVLKRAAADSIRRMIPAYFACDVGKASSTRIGVLDPDVRSVDRLLGVDLDTQTRAQQLDARTMSATHAMVLAGYQPSRDRVASRWQVVNSWEKAPEFVMSDAWFEAYVMLLVVPKSSLLAAAGLKKLPPADPAQTLVTPFWDVFGNHQ